MALRINLSPEELEQLDRLLQREIANTRNELRRTARHSYRERVEHELGLLEHIHQTVAMAEESIDLTIG